MLTPEWWDEQVTISNTVECLYFMKLTNFPNQQQNTCSRKSELDTEVEFHTCGILVYSKQIP